MVKCILPHIMELPLDLERIVYSYILLVEVPHMWEWGMSRPEMMLRLPVLPYSHKQELTDLELDAFIAYILIHKELPSDNEVLARRFYSELPLCVQRLILLYDTNKYSYYTKIEFSNSIPSAALSLDMSTLSFTKGGVGDRLLTSAIMYTFENEDTSTFGDLKRKTQPHAIIQDHVPFIEHVIPYIHPSEFNQYAFEALYHNNERAFRVL